MLARQLFESADLTAAQLTQLPGLFQVQFDDLTKWRSRCALIIWHPGYRAASALHDYALLTSGIAAQMICCLTL